MCCGSFPRDRRKPLICAEFVDSSELDRGMQSRLRRRSEKDVGERDNERLRYIMHELSNLLTGVLVSGGLLKQALKGDRREHYVAEICDAGERGAGLVREARGLLHSAVEQLPRP